MLGDTHPCKLSCMSLQNLEHSRQSGTYWQIDGGHALLLTNVPRLSAFVYLSRTGLSVLTHCLLQNIAASLNSAVWCCHVEIRQLLGDASFCCMQYGVHTHPSLVPCPSISSQLSHVGLRCLTHHTLQTKLDLLGSAAWHRHFKVRQKFPPPGLPQPSLLQPMIMKTRSARKWPWGHVSESPQHSHPCSGRHTWCSTVRRRGPAPLPH